MSDLRAPVIKRTGYFKSFDGTRIYYEVRCPSDDPNNTAKPLVFAYGIGCLINHWQYQIKAFSGSYKTIVFDYRGHHKSDLPVDRESMTIDGLARDLNLLMDHLELERASFWGHSFGAQVLIRAYDLAPQYFDNLVFINGFASDPITGMFGNGVASQLFRYFKTGFDYAPETLTYLWEKGTANPFSVQLAALLGGFNIHLTSLKDIEIYLRGVSALDMAAFLRLFQDMMDYDGRPVYERIEVPTLIISGAKDSITPQKYQEDMNKKIKGSEFQLVPYGSHCTQLDMPDFVNLRVERFLESSGYSPNKSSCSPIL